MSSEDERKSRITRSAIILLALSINSYLQLSNLSKEKKLDIPNYPINIDVPAISDGDDKIVTIDFSFVNTNDGRTHFCYEKNSNGTIDYYDVKEGKTIDKSTIDIDHILKFEDVISEQVPIDKDGYCDPKQLDQAVSATMEEYGVKVIEKKMGN